MTGLTTDLLVYVVLFLDGMLLIPVSVSGEGKLRISSGDVVGNKGVVLIISSTKLSCVCFRYTSLTTRVLRHDSSSKQSGKGHRSNLG